MSKSLFAAGAAIAGTVGFLAAPGAVAQAAPAPATSASPRLIGPAFAPTPHALGGFGVSGGSGDVSGKSGSNGATGAAGAAGVAGKNGTVGHHDHH